MRKLFISMIAFMVFILTACTSDDDQDSEAAAEEPQSEEETTEEEVAEEEETFTPSEFEYYELEETARPLTDLEQELLRKPGPYSGENYNEEEVQEEVDKLPDDLTAEEYVHELKYLLAEDYHKEIETFANFDSEVTTDVQSPDETIEEPEMTNAHYAILIDASGSMHADTGGQTRWEAAKSAVTDFASEIPEASTVSLKVYGHKGTGSDADKELSCSSIETIFNDHYKQKDFKSALNDIDPSGWTPIASALESSEGDIPESADRAVVYVVSDGIETCGGDPVKAAQELVDKDIETAVNIIGFDVDNEGQKLLKDVADAGDGEFVYVDSESQLNEYMREQYEEIQEAWHEWKEEGKSQAYDQKEEKKQLANETKESVKEKADREKQHLKAAQEYLEDRFEDYDHPARSTFSPIIDYANEIWGYGVDTGNDLWGESVDSGNEEWGDYVDEGNEKINETIDKKNEH
ncbi:VWA domain-containing protein [Lentibacillus salicampi]|uniref:VWA domain-containing protein n=1 Tax=Lentibacillus salicampi TaxID=175306 RepID=A0A4Y9A6L3_9BACI|nr:VWA domain-containing protein [Lentibacillus salicampi]TFJ91283.1 VWA domain-containing protein [Lentibacillus salicampi]